MTDDPIYQAELAKARRRLRSGETFRRLAGPTHLYAAMFGIMALVGRADWSFAFAASIALFVGPRVGGKVVDAVERTPFGFLSYFLGLTTYLIVLFVVGAIAWAFFDAVLPGTSR